MEKPAIRGPMELSHATPSMMSAPSTGRTNNGTKNVFLLSSSGTFGKKLLHSRCWLFPTMTGKEVIVVSLVLSKETRRGWIILCMLPQ